jgi:Rrf2 family protein
MKVLAKEEYGLRAMAELAKRYGEGPVSLSEVEYVQDLSLDYLEQIFPSLRAAGLVNSTRGAKGGYELSRSPDEITIANVIRSLTGEILSIQCVSEKSSHPCSREDVCTVRPIWEALYKRILETFDNITLADLRLPDRRE